jgi:hypothetical protein
MQDANSRPARVGTASAGSEAGASASPGPRLYFPMLAVLLALGFALTLLDWAVLNGSSLA